VFEKARDRAEKPDSGFGFEWLQAENGIALANLGLGRVEEASQVADRTLAAAVREWGMASIPATDTLDVLGLVRLAHSRLAEAEAALSQSRARRERIFGKNHPRVAASYLHAALLSLARADNASALRSVRRALNIERELAVAGPNGRWAMTLLAGAEILAKVGQIGDAKECYENAIPVLEQELGPHVPRLEEARKRYAALPKK
jgi:tetratricopeptide (TPR) repeat protein